MKYEKKSPIYQSNITIDQWEQIKHYFEDSRGAHLRKHSKLELFNACLYVLKTGCQWRQIPNDFPKWGTVYSFYSRMCLDGTIEKISDALTKISREQNDRNPIPTHIIVDSQSVKMANHGEQKGIDGGKRIKGRKRHMATDTMGNVVFVKAHAANIHDTIAGVDIVNAVVKKNPATKTFSVDKGYRGTTKNFAEKVLGKTLLIASNEENTWKVVTWRWVVERTFAWLGNYRRLSKDYEYGTLYSESFVYLANIFLIIKRLF